MRGRRRPGPGPHALGRELALPRGRPALDRSAGANRCRRGPAPHAAATGRRRRRPLSRPAAGRPSPRWPTAARGGRVAAAVGGREVGDAAGPTDWNACAPGTQTFPNEAPLAGMEGERPAASRRFAELAAYLEKSPDGRRGDPRRGRRVFQKAQCARCHRHGTEGGGIGPDLTTVAKRFKRSTSSNPSWNRPRSSATSTAR